MVIASRSAGFYLAGTDLLHMHLALAGQPIYCDDDYYYCGVQGVEPVRSCC